MSTVEGVTMQDFNKIFSSFSSRNDLSGKEIKPLTEEFKNRTFMYCAEVHNYQTFWEKMQKKFLYLLGGSFAVKYGAPAIDNLAHLLSTCTDERFLDFVEYIFQLQKPISPRSWERNGSRIWPPREQGKVSPENINIFFDQDELPYYLTDYVWQQTDNNAFSVARLPQVICRDNELLHVTIVEPVTTLLRDKPEFHVADEEFADALSDYRKQNFRECVTKCCNALESAMKIICNKNGWGTRPDKLPFDKLLKTIISNTDLNDSYSKITQLLASVRSTQGSAHAGITKRDVSRNVAQFVINLTGAAILLLVEESGL